MPSSVLTLPSGTPVNLVITLVPSGQLTISVSLASDESLPPDSSKGVTSLVDALPAEVPQPECRYADAPAAETNHENPLDPARQPGERDLDYVRRLERANPALKLLLREWSMRLHNVSLGELRAAKKHGLLKHERLGHTRGGNGHLIPVPEIVRLLSEFERVELREGAPPAWYSAVRSVTHHPRERAS